ncbi:MAG TPA: outer membrane protein assembly factor BamE [Burkholderiaceae bacterium]|nr:outer membrane protein assembly factor BamE [Burkholderiaceae bacterium]
MSDSYMTARLRKHLAKRSFYRRVLAAFRHLAPRATTIAGLCALFTVVAGCDARKIEQLIPGQATEAEVGATMGRPTAIYELDTRARILEFARAPEGQVTYFAEIGPDGKLARRIENVLTAQNFARIRVGMSEDEVRRIIGTPSYTEQYKLKPGERIWTWRWLRNQGNESMIFSAHFGPEGRVVTTSEGIDPRTIKN